MAAEGVLHPFLEQQIEGLAQAEQHVLRWRAGIFLVVGVAFTFGPVPVRRAQVRLLVRLARTVVGGDEAEARRHHQALLRARHSNVDAPFVHLKLHAA